MATAQELIPSIWSERSIGFTARSEELAMDVTKQNVFLLRLRFCKTLSFRLRLENMRRNVALIQCLP
jgi:hypothetical protein